MADKDTALTDRESQQADHQPDDGRRPRAQRAADINGIHDGDQTESIVDTRQVGAEDHAVPPQVPRPPQQQEVDVRRRYEASSDVISRVLLAAAERAA